MSTITYSTFPDPNSIPPSNFFTLQGLPGWLNEHPTYKQYFINNPKYFPQLLMGSTVSEYAAAAKVAPDYGIYEKYQIEKIPLAPFITMNDQNDLRMFRDHIRLFRQVYEHNSNAWMAYIEKGVEPVYYRFPSSSERTRYLTARGTVYKLYPFDAIANATSEMGSTLGWVIPFPL